MSQLRDKLVIDLPADEETSAETLWAVKDADNGNLFKLDNVPMLAYGLALGDLVRAELRDDDRWHFVKMVKPSGLLTVRVAGPHVEESRFAGVVALLKPNSIASERLSERYIGYAMEPAAFAKVESAIDDIIGSDSEEFAVEIANDLVTKL